MLILIFIATVFLASTASFSYAEKNIEAKRKATNEDCIRVLKISKRAMEARQSGAPFGKMLDLANENELIVYITTEAYKAPIYVSKERKEKSIMDFSKNFFLKCLAPKPH